MWGLLYSSNKEMSSYEEKSQVLISHYQKIVLIDEHYTTNKRQGLIHTN